MLKKKKRIKRLGVEEKHWMAKNSDNLFTNIIVSQPVYYKRAIWGNSGAVTYLRLNWIL